jgi:hypothetical protein
MAAVRVCWLRKARTGVDPDLSKSAKTACKFLVPFAIVVLSGCSAPSASLPAYMHPERLYLQARPYSRLYVEIDRMEGASLPESFLDELKAFLAEHCLKPDGVDVVVDPPIPTAEFENVPLSWASILSTDGPIAGGKPQPAYLHLFIYDGKTMFEGAMRNPRVVLACPSGVFFNVDYARIWPNQTKMDMLTHELGHILGLCQNTAHGDGSHCGRHGCLMYPTPDWLSQWGGMVHLYYRKHRLCSECERDLEQARQAPRDDNVSFSGPFLVRKANGYCVASLPFCDTIIGTPAPTEFNWRKALTQTKAGIKQVVRNEMDEGRDPRTGHEGVMVGLYDRPGVETCPERLEQDIALLSRAVNDPSVDVSRLASRILRKRQDALAAQVR